MKDQQIYNKNILLNINKKGDLSKISKDELYKIFAKPEKNYLIIELIYCVFQDLERLKILISDFNNKILLFECIQQFNLLFSNSFKLFPNYIFLIDIAKSINDIKSILKCSNKLTDFIYLINEKKEYIIKFIEKENEIVLTDFFNISKAFNESFDDHFYFTLNKIEEFENKNNKKIFHLIYEKSYLKKIIEFKQDASIILIKIYIFLYLRHEIFTIKELINLIGIFISKNIEFLNNFEIIEIIDILSNDYNTKKDALLLGLVSAIKYEKLNKNLLSFFFKIKWENIIENSDNYASIVIHMINSLTNILNIEFIFIIIDKLKEIQNNKKIRIKEEIKEKNYYKKPFKANSKNIILFISQLQKKYFKLLKDINNMDNDKKEEIVQISSKLIYLSDEYRLLENFLDEISIIIESDLLNEIFIHTLENYEISNWFILITISIKKNKFWKLYNFMLKKSIEKFETLLNQNIIDEKITIFFEKDYFNLLLLDNLYKKKYFELYNSSSYAIETIKKLENFGNNIIEMKNISYNQMISIKNKKAQLDNRRRPDVWKRRSDG